MGDIVKRGSEVRNINCLTGQLGPAESRRRQASQ
jgi:hypothetical protein